MIDPRLLNSARDTIHVGSKSFAAAARLLPADIRDHTILLYTWCRYCDDVVDGQTGGGVMRPVENIADAVQSLRDQTGQAMAGRPEGVPFEALATVVRSKRLSPEVIEDHLTGYAMDASGQTYRCIEDTLMYAYHVAGTVGILMAQIMGVRKTDHLCHAADLGIAFQLTNIARDVVEDAKAGRCYLPKDWLEEAGLAELNLTSDTALDGYKAVAERLLDYAEPYYTSARSAICTLPPECRWGIAAAMSVYQDVGRGVRRGTVRQWTNRVSTSRARKLALIGSSFFEVHARKTDCSERAGRMNLWTPLALRKRPERDTDGQITI